MRIFTSCLVAILLTSYVFAEDDLATRVKLLEAENALLKIRVQRLEFLVNKMVKDTPPPTGSGSVASGVIIVQPEVVQTPQRVRANYVVTYRDSTTQPIVTWEKNDYIINDFDRRRKVTQYTFHLENGSRIKVDVDKVDTITPLAKDN